MAKKHKKNKKWLTVVMFLVLFIAAAVIVFLVWDSYFKDKKGGGQELETGEQVEIEDIGENSDELDNGEIIEKPKTEQYDGENPNEMEVLTGAITFARVSGDNLLIRNNIDQYLESGTCELFLSKEGEIIYNNVANIAGNVSTSTCEGFDVPVSELGGSGAITIKINLDSGEKTGIIWGEIEI